MQRQHGFTLIEAIAALIILTLLIPVFVRYQTMGWEETEQAAAAQQMRQVDQAAEAYVQQNYSTLQATATPGTPVTFTTAPLIATGFLPAGFRSTNPYGQSYQVSVLQPSPGDLQVMVFTTGGQTAQNGFMYQAKSVFANQTIPHIAAMVGAEGGYVPTGVVPGQSTTIAQGAFGGWQVPLTNYPSPGIGHLADFLYFTQGTLSPQYLYRVAVPGQPQLNQMQTDLSMGGHNITFGADVGANTVTLNGAIRQSVNGTNQLAITDMSGTPQQATGDDFVTAAGQSLAITPQFAGIVTNGAAVPVPACHPGLNPQIFVADAGSAAVAAGSTNAAAKVWSWPYAQRSGSNWLVYMLVEDNQGNLYGGPANNLSPVYNHVFVLTKCS